MKKSTVEEIRQRFDADVERFANLETGQSATVDAPLAMDLIVRGLRRSRLPRCTCSISAAARAITR